MPWADINNDGILNISDILLLVKYITDSNYDEAEILSSFTGYGAENNYTQGAGITTLLKMVNVIVGNLPAPTPVSGGITGNKLIYSGAATLNIKGYEVYCSPGFTSGTTLSDTAGSGWIASAGPNGIAAAGTVPLTISTGTVLNNASSIATLVDTTTEPFQSTIGPRESILLLADGTIMPVTTGMFSLATGKNKRQVKTRKANLIKPKPIRAKKPITL